MKLSDRRINSISYKIAFHLVKKRMISTPRNLRQVTSWIEKPFFDVLGIEEEINFEVHKIMESMSTCPPKGSDKYNIIFNEKKRELAKKRNYEY